MHERNQHARFERKMGKGRAPCCDKTKVRTGPWSPAEDLCLVDFVLKNGHTNWRALPKQAGLLRCGKSCRLRWVNYLRPDVKRGNFTPQEEETIIQLYNSIGKKWSKIASYLPGRTDNEIKNVWNTHLKKRVMNMQNNIGENGQGKNSKMDTSAASSSTTTPGDENTINPSDHHNEPKQTAVSDADSSLFSCISNFDNFSPEKTLGYSESNKATFAHDGFLDNDKVEIPCEFDVDYWELLDSLEPLQESNISIDTASFDGEDPVRKWLRFLENELGLTSTECDVGITAPPPLKEMNIESEISAVFDYTSI